MSLYQIWNLKAHIGAWHHSSHPDTMMARGLPIELVGLANHKMAMVNKAYSEILSQRSED